MAAAFSERTTLKPQLKLPTQEERATAWRIWDVDCDGELTLTELRRAIKLSFPAYSDIQVLARATTAADNGDGKISRREFGLLLEYIVYFNNLDDKFTQLDADGSGELSLEEFVEGVEVLKLKNRAGVRLQTHKLPEIFKQIDASGDGVVDFEEFATWAAHTQIGRPPREKGRPETPERERESETEVEGEQGKAQSKVWSPWKGLALRDFNVAYSEEGSPLPPARTAAHHSDLTFRKGDIIELTSMHSKWWSGYCHGHHGTFPMKYVKLVPPTAAATSTKHSKVKETAQSAVRQARLDFEKFGRLEPPRLWDDEALVHPPRFPIPPLEELVRRRTSGGLACLTP
jgi:Ca2+-binding EF-hand superfamily protein